MVVEERKNNLNKLLYKIELLTLKVLPFVLAVLYFLNTLLSIFSIDLPILSYVGGVSFIPLIFMYLSSYVFRFCEYHRLPLHYILINNILNIIGYSFNISLSLWIYIIIHVLLMCITLFVILYLYLKSRR